MLGRYSMFRNNLKRVNFFDSKINLFNKIKFSPFCDKPNDVTTIITLYR